MTRAPSTPAPMRPRRSLLYMPGANARAMEKARGLPCDGVILDLEDAVAADAKVDAWGADDLAAAAKSGADAVLVPKISRPDDLTTIDAMLDSHGAPKSMRIWAMMETPDAMFWSRAISASTPRLAVLVMGTNDLLKELNATARPDRAPLMTCLQMCLLAARASKIGIIDGVFNAISDAHGFEAECVQGKELGFDGKTLIHPSQVEIANRVFAPTEAEIEHARRVVAAFDEAQAAGKGVVQLDGKMIENLHVDNARRALAYADILARS